MSGQRRVAHVISAPANIGGAERVVQALVDGAPMSDWSMQVLNLFVQRPDTSGLRAAVPQRTYSGLTCSGIHGLPALQWSLRRALSVLRPHIIHAHLFHASALVAMLPHQHQIPRLLTHHHGNIFSAERSRAKEAVDHFATKRFDRVVPVSRAGQEFLISRYRVRPHRLQVILNGWSGTPRASTAPDDAPTVICTANFRQQKGHTVLLAAFQQVLDQVSAARLLLVGAGPLESAVAQEIADRGLHSAVSMCGHVDDVWPYLAASHVFALASHHEPLGIAVIEAMAAGLPVVASDVGGLPELVEPGVTGELFPKGDATALASDLIGLLTDPARARQLGANGAARAKTLTTDAMVKRYFALYDEVLEERRRPPTRSSTRRDT